MKTQIYVAPAVKGLRALLKVSTVIKTCYHMNHHLFFYLNTQVFDKDNNGYIDPEELRSTMKELGMELDDVDLKAMMDAAGCKIPNRLYYEGGC